MAKRKNEQVRAVNLERLSRNPRPSRQEKTLGGKPLFQVPHPLSEVRESIGMSQWQLANASGVPRSAIANYELGRYAFSARDGIELFIVLARNAAPKSLEYRKAKENAAKLVADQRE